MRWCEITKTSCQAIHSCIFIRAAVIHIYWQLVFLSFGDYCIGSQKAVLIRSIFGWYKIRGPTSGFKLILETIKNFAVLEHINSFHTCLVAFSWLSNGDYQNITWYTSKSTSLELHITDVRDLYYSNKLNNYLYLFTSPVSSYIEQH